MTKDERAWRQDVMVAARQRGWHIAYFPDSRRIVGSRGLPDLILARDGKVILAELKTDSGKLSEVQRRWLEAAGASGRVWRPADRVEIMQELD